MNLWNRGKALYRALRTVDFEDPFKRQRSEFYITLCLSSIVGMLPTLLIVPFAPTLELMMSLILFTVMIMALSGLGIYLTRRGHIDQIAPAASAVVLVSFFLLSLPLFGQERLAFTNLMWGIPFVVILLSSVLQPKPILWIGALGAVCVTIYVLCFPDDWSADATLFVIASFLLICTFVAYLQSGRTRDTLFTLVEQNRALEAARVLAEEKRAEAEEANAAKSLFLANVTHELRTPLTTILGYSELVLEEVEGNAAMEEDVSHIERSGRELLSMIDDLLDLSTLDAGTLNPEIEAVDLTTLMISLAKEYAPRAERRGNRLEMDISRLKTIHTDPRRVRQILDNLLSNAIKFTQDGDITLRASLSEEHVTLEVQDTGAGMTPQKIARALAPFSQSLSSVSKDHRGVGLSLTDRLAKLLGGALEFDSEVGVGTTARVRLPRRDSGLG